MGIDVDLTRVEQLQRGYDRNRDIAEGTLATPLLRFTGSEKELLGTDIFIVTAPTPVDKAYRPYLCHLVMVSETVGCMLRDQTELRPTEVANAALPVVVYECTVYPGCTEEVYAHVLEEFAGGSIGV